MFARIVAVMMVGILGCQQPGGSDVKLEDSKDKVSYSLGLNVGTSLLRDSIMVNPEAFLQGVLDASADSADCLMTREEVDATLTAFQTEMRTKQAERSSALKEKNRLEGDKFLAENSQKEGVVTLPSGLQYKIIRQGEGAKPTAGSTVEVNYSGRLIDGTEFDSSYKRGEAAVFRVGGVIKGWTEALQLMNTGSKWQLYIPSALGYGEAGAGGGTIPPNATLIFDVELISIK